MTARILLATDGSQFSLWAVEYLCRALHGVTEHGAVSLVHVEFPVPLRAARAMGREIVSEFYERQSSQAMRPAGRCLARHRVPYQPILLVGNPGEALARCARDRQADLLVMGARGLGALRSFVLGSTTQRVLAECAVPALIIRRQPSRRISSRVLIAVDGSRSSMRAVRAFLSLRPLFAQEPQLVLVHATTAISRRAAGYLKLGPREQYYASLARAAMKDARVLLRRQGLAFEEVTLVGEPAYDLPEFASKGRFGLVVMGSHGYGAAKSLVFGSTAQRVLSQCTVPALIVR